MKLEQVADTVKEGIDYHMENKTEYNIFCGPGHPATDEMIVAQLANHFTTEELYMMDLWLTLGFDEDSVNPRHVVQKLLGLISINRELINDAMLERQGEVYVDWSGESYMGDNW